MPWPATRRPRAPLGSRAFGWAIGRRARACGSHGASPPPGDIELDATLLELAEQDPGSDVDVIIALVGALPVATFSFYDLGRANVLGKHIAIRSMSNAVEIRAIDTLDALEPEERSRMYRIATE
jgi:hypothetical protein